MVVENKVDRGGRDWLPAQGAAQRLGFLTVEGGVVGDVFNVAVTLAGSEGDATEQGVGDARRVKHALHERAAVVAGAQSETGFRGIVSFLLDERYRTDFRAAAEQRALRTSTRSRSNNSTTLARERLMETPSWKRETRVLLRGSPLSVVTPRMLMPGLLGDCSCTMKPGTNGARSLYWRILRTSRAVSV